MERVIYKTNPLIEVIIQLRFPKMLSLNSADPIEFQETIKNDFPIYQLTIENQQEITLKMDASNLPTPSIVNKQPIRNHNFISKDGLYKINLTGNFISISTLKYTRWEDLLEHFDTPLKTFLDIYHPPFFERIGLRYIDAFSRKKLNLEDVAWKELICEPWIGVYKEIDEKQIINASTEVEFYLDDNKSIVKVHSGIGTVNNNPEKVFVIDSDFFLMDTITVESSNTVLAYLHDNSKVFIRNAITDKLHQAMGPEPVK